MNWDISIGQGKQWYGRLLQTFGQRFERRHLVLDGERIEYAGRLQTRYGLLKHQVQWGATLVRIPRDPPARSLHEDALRSADPISR